MNKKNLILRLLFIIVVGPLVGSVFYFVSWLVLMKGLHFPVAQFFALNNWKFLTWLFLMFYMGEWFVYFIVSWKKRKEKVWTLRRSIRDHFEQYLEDAGETKLKELREKANVTKQTVAVLLSLSGVVISIYILGWLRLLSGLELSSYQEVFFYFMGLALISALAPLFVSLESLDTAANPLFDDTGKKNYLEHLYSRGTKWYLVGLACFMFSLLCGLAIVEVLISLIGTVLFLIFILFHNYYCIEN